MAPKRAAKKAAPPPPPAESSDETRSGSRSRSEESDDEEEAIAESPVPAATPAPKHAPAPALNGDASESSGEEEDDEEEEGDEEEEEEDQSVRAAPKNQPPPPPQEKEDSGSDDDMEEEEEYEEEEEEEEPTLAAPPSVPKKQPPPPQKEQDSDTSGSDDDEEEEVQPPKPAANKETAAPNPPAPAAEDAKKPGGIQRIWSTDDELRILESIAALQTQHGAFPQPEALIDALAGKLDNPAYGSKELMSKVKALKHRYVILSKKGEVPSKEHDRRLLDLSKIVWEGADTTLAVSNGHHGHKGFEEMCEMYPYLAEEVKELEAARPGMCKRVFGKMDDDKARAMDEKIKKQRVMQIRVEMRRGDLAKEVTKALIDLVDG